MKNNNLEGALTLLQKAGQLKSDLRVAHVDRGRILTQQKWYDEAIAAFQRAIERAVLALPETPADAPAPARALAALLADWLGRSDPEIAASAAGPTTSADTRPNEESYFRDAATI